MRVFGEKSILQKSGKLLNTLLLLSIPLLAESHLFGATIALHQKSPEFVRVDLQQKTIDLRALRGKVVLLNFWATWCAPCKIEIPQFVAWQGKYGPRGLQIIGISMDDNLDTVRRASKKLKLNYPVAMGDSTLTSLYGNVSDLPRTFLIDANGIVQAEFSGEADLNYIEKRFLPLLR